MDELLDAMDPMAVGKPTGETIACLVISGISLLIYPYNKLLQGYTVTYRQKQLAMENCSKELDKHDDLNFNNDCP